MALNIYEYEFKKRQKLIFAMVPGFRLSDEGLGGVFSGRLVVPLLHVWEVVDGGDEATHGDAVVVVVVAVKRRESVSFGGIVCKQNKLQFSAIKRRLH